MKKYKGMPLLDITAQLMLRIKLIVYDKLCLFVFAVSMLLFVLLVNSLSIQADSGAYISIGVINEDIDSNKKPTEMSSVLIEAMENNGILRCVYGSYEELTNSMYNGYINSVFIINEGYQKKVQAGINKELISIVQADNDNTTIFAQDIITGEMMYDICTYAALQYYSTLKGGTIRTTNEEYAEYVYNLMYGMDTPFKFNVNFVGESIKKIDRDNVGVSMLYKQMIAGIAAMMYSFVALFVMMQSVGEHIGGLQKRRQISFLAKVPVFAANILSSFPLLVILSLVFSGCMANSLADKISFKDLFIYSVMYCICMAVIFEIIAVISHGIMFYQLIGAAVVILFGAAGFCSMISGVVNVEIGILEDIVPNCWYINKFLQLLY